MGTKSGPRCEYIINTIARFATTCAVECHSDGGPLGLIADRIAVRQVGRSLAEGLKNLHHLVEP